MKIVHLPSYEVNPYQRNLAEAQRKLGHEVLEGGGGGSFLRTALFQWKADVLHFHWLHPYLLRPNRLGSVLRSLRFLLEIMMIRLTGTRIAWTIHNLKNHDNHHTGIERFFSIPFARCCRVCIVHSEHAAEMAGRRFFIRRKRLQVIPHPSYVGLYPDVMTREESRTKLGIPREAFVFLFLGRINAYKGIFDLIEAFQGLGTDERLRLLIAGSPENDATRDRILKETVSDERILAVLERIGDDDLQMYFKAADVAVYPYRQILTSGAVILGMSFGSFLIAPDVPTLRETVAPGGGLFFKPCSRNSLQEEMRVVFSMDTANAGITNLYRSHEWRLEKIADMTVKAVG